jgi:O-antigen/teichoic acid export membrane protein
LENSYQKFAKDVLIIGVTNVLVTLSAIILLPLITKTLGAYDYGIWAQVQVTISLVLGFVGLGLPYAMTRFLPAKTNKEEIQEEFYSVLLVVFLATAVVSVILIAFARFVAEAFFAGATDVVGITGLIILVWSLDSVFLSVFRTFRQMKRYALFTIASTYAQIGLIAYLVLNGHGILGMVLAVLAIEGVILLVLCFLIKSQIGIRRPRFSTIREYLSFGLPTIPGSISAWVVASSDRYVIGYFLGVTSVGVYSAGYGLGSVIMMPAGILGFVLPPTLSKLYDEGRMDEVKTHLSYSLKYTLATTIPFVFGSAILAEPVLRLFSTAQIASDGYFIVPLVALGILFYSTYAIIGHILVVAKKTKIMGLIWIIAAVVNLGLNIVVVPHLGILGAALTTLVAYILALGVGTYYSFREFRFRIDWRFIAKSVIASMTMSSVIWVMHPQSNIATIVAVIVGAAVYGLAIFLLKGFRREEIGFFRTLLGRRAGARQRGSREVR